MLGLAPRRLLYWGPEMTPGRVLCWGIELALWQPLFCGLEVVLCRAGISGFLGQAAVVDGTHRNCACHRDQAAPTHLVGGDGTRGELEMRLWIHLLEIRNMKFWYVVWLSDLPHWALATARVVVAAPATAVAQAVAAAVAAATTAELQAGPSGCVCMAAGPASARQVHAVPPGQVGEIAGHRWEAELAGWGLCKSNRLPSGAACQVTAPGHQPRRRNVQWLRGTNGATFLLSSL
jgi:hypothetical protein